MNKYFASVVASLFSLAMTAQTSQQLIPTDTAVRIGKLENGLTYYIRHNDEPAKRVNFYLAQRVGSIQEEENQRGLAHFLEHMCFNGTVHFPGNRVVEYLESLGVKFGENLNAYTSIDRTVYNISNVPSTRVTSLDSCLLVLRDWSGGLTLDSTEIDKERGVIHEEWRLRTSPSSRMLERNLETVYPGSKYGRRMPIGKMEIVDNFKPAALRDYYRRWYRPDNQAVIIVGDVDVNAMEQKVKTLFGSIGVDKNAPPVVDEPVPDNAKPIVIVDQDKEQQTDFVQIMFKYKAIGRQEKAVKDYIVYQTIKNMVMGMLFNRINEPAQNADCPYTQGSVGYGVFLFSKTKYAFQLTVIPKPGQTEASLKAIVEEALRAARYGFTPTEFDRAKARSINAAEVIYANRRKKSNVSFCAEYVENFLSYEPLPSAETLYAMKTDIIGKITLADANRFMRSLMPSADSNVVVINFNNEKEGRAYPTPATLQKALDEAFAAKLTPYKDEVKNEPLVKSLPSGGRIVSTGENKALGYKMFRLSNGARVILKKTDFNDNEILMSAVSPGGSSLLDAKDFINAKFFNKIINSGGLGSFSSIELQKKLAGKSADVNLSLDTYQEELSGYAVPKDLETMFQLAYLYFTHISKDQKAFDNLISRYEATLKNKSLSPDMALSDSLVNTLHARNPRFSNYDAADLKRINYDRILQIAKERMANAADFTFTFVGNFDEKTLLSLVKKYIAVLPSNKGRETERDVESYARGEVVNQFTRKMETPKAKAYLIWYNDGVENTLDNMIEADATGQILTAVYIKKIREEASAAYSADSRGSVAKQGKKTYVKLYAICPMKPEKADTALKIMRDEVNALARKVDGNILESVKQYMLKKNDEQLRQNRYWIKAIDMFEEDGIDIVTDYKKQVEALTPESISAFVRNVVLAQGNHIEVIMLPEK